MRGTTFTIAMLALLLGSARTSRAQQPIRPFAGISPLTAITLRQAPSPIAMRSVSSAQDHRWEGAIMGGAVGVVLGAIAGAVICSQDDTDGNNCPLTIVGVAALTGAPLAILGGVIGANIEKRPSP